MFGSKTEFPKGAAKPLHRRMRTKHAVIPLQHQKLLPLPRHQIPLAISNVHAAIAGLPETRAILARVEYLLSQSVGAFSASTTNTELASSSLPAAAAAAVAASWSAPCLSQPLVQQTRFSTWHRHAFRPVDLGQRLFIVPTVRFQPLLPNTCAYGELSCVPAPTHRLLMDYLGTAFSRYSRAMPRQRRQGGIV